MKRLIVLASMLLLFSIAYSQAKQDAIVGEWTSPKKDSRIFIYKKGDRYFGKITWGTGVSKDENNPNKLLRSRDLVGLENLKDFKFDGSETWEDGTIYDPREGKTYSCKITFKNENQLSIRGYVGISLFGRTDIWTKYKAPQINN